MGGILDFSGQTALVTGASGGIGAAVARLLAGHGARVLCHYHANEEGARALLDSLPGGPHGALRADLASPDETRDLVEAAAAGTGRLDVLVNNAGVFFHHPLAETDYDAWQAAWRRTLDLNLTGPANACWCAGRRMIAQGGGRIVNVSSRGAFRGEPAAPAYGASKAGLNSLTQSLARALAPHGVVVTAVAPGFVETEMAAPFLAGPDGDSIRAQSPLGRVATPEEVARAVLYLAAPGCEYLTGAIVDVNGASYLRS